MIVIVPVPVWAWMLDSCPANGLPANVAAFVTIGVVPLAVPVIVIVPAPVVPGVPDPVNVIRPVPVVDGVPVDVIVMLAVPVVRLRMIPRLAKGAFANATPANTLRRRDAQVARVQRDDTCAATGCHAR